MQLASCICNTYLGLIEEFIVDYHLHFNVFIYELLLIMQITKTAVPMLFEKLKDVS